MPQHAPSLRSKKHDTRAIAAISPNWDGVLDEWEGRRAVSQGVGMDAMTPRQVVSLQRMVGNQTVQRMIGRSPTRTAGPSGDEQQHRRATGLSPSQEASPPIAGITPTLASPLSPVSDTLQRTPTPRISHFTPTDSMRVQRRAVLANRPGHFHRIDGSPQGDAKAKIRQIRKAKRAKRFEQFDEINISDSVSEHITDGDGKPVWYRVESGPLNVVNDRQYVLAEKVFANLKDKPTDQDVAESDPELDTVGKLDVFESSSEVVNEVDNALVDVTRGFELKEDLYEQELSESEAKTYHESTVAEGTFWAAGGVMGMVSGIIGMAQSLKDFTSDEATTWDKVEAVFNLIASGSDYLGSGMGVMGGASQIANSYQSEDTPDYDLSDSIASWGLGLQGMFSALSNGVKTILDVVTLIRMLAQQLTSKEKFDRDEWLEKANSLMTNALETAKSIITTYRVMWEFLNDSVTGAFEAVVPGIDIAISAVKSIFQGYYLCKSAYHWFQMARARRAETARLLTPGRDKESIERARKFYGKREGLISNTDHHINKNQKSLAKRTLKLSHLQAQKPSKFAFVNKRNQKKEEKLKRQITEGFSEHKNMLSRRDDAFKQMKDFEDNKIDLDGNTLPPTTGTNTGGTGTTTTNTGGTGGTGTRGTNTTAPQTNQTPQNLSRLELGELNLSSELSSANAKRVVRQSIHIGANLIKIAGAIVTIVGGTGAPAGVALKALGAGVDISLPFFRSLKQFGRNKAGKAQAKGKKNLFTKVFDPNKSNVAKLQHRKRQAVTILLMVADLNKYIPKAQDQQTRDQERETLKERVAHIERHMYAAGVSPKKLYRLNGKPGEQVKLLVEAMCKREIT